MKETRKQIVEQTRNEVIKQYNTKLQHFQERINKLAKDYAIERQKRIECQEKFDELQEKVNQYEDWIQRLQEFMDMPESQREEYIVYIKDQENINKTISKILNYINFMF